jgi:integrase
LEMPTSAVGRLTKRQIDSAKPKAGSRRAILADGQNLYLQISTTKTGAIARSWIFRYERLGRRREAGLGPVHTVGLKDAREKAKALRLQILDGVDPLGAKQQIRAAERARIAERARAMTFSDCFESCLKAHEGSWRNSDHRRQWRNSIEQDVLPVIGDLPVDLITTQHIIKVLEPIWTAKPETASRIRGRIERVLAWGTVRGFRSGDNPARWRGHLQEMFPARGKIAKTNHHAAMAYTAIPEFMTKLRAQDHVAAKALEFLVLTASRAGEVVGMRWDEVDLTAKTWTIPAKRMKSGREHRVPLSDRAIEIFKARPQREARIFSIGDDAMRLALGELHGDGATVHGMRSAFRDWASERTSYPPAVAEQALAHVTGGKTERAYARSDLFEKRRRLMADWAAWCSRPVPAGATITSIAAVR